MRIVFMGSPDFAVLPLQQTLEAGFEIAAVVSQPDRPRGKRGQEFLPTPVKKAATTLGLPVITPNEINTPEVVKQLRAFHPDLLVVVAFGCILSKELLEIPPLGAINIHGSLLPNYRGAAPIQRALMNGDRQSGVTIMYLDASMDSGDMILQQALPLHENETFGSLHDRLTELGSQLLLAALSLIESGRAPRIAQDKDRATYAPKISREEELVDWRDTAATIHNRIRALDPFPGAYTLYQGKRLKLFGSRSAIGRGVPGEILSVTKDGMSVACGEGAVLISQVQPEGKIRMPADAFARGYQINTGGII